MHTAAACPAEPGEDSPASLCCAAKETHQKPPHTLCQEWKGKICVCCLLPRSHMRLREGPGFVPVCFNCNCMETWEGVGRQGGTPPGAPLWLGVLGTQHPRGPSQL